MSNTHTTKATMIAARLRQAGEAVTAVENTIATRGLRSDLYNQASDFEALALKSSPTTSLRKEQRDKVIQDLRDASTALNAAYWATSRNDIEEFTTDQQNEVDAFRRSLEAEDELTATEKVRIDAVARAFGIIS